MVSGGGVQFVSAIVIVIILVIMTVVGIILLVVASKSDEGYDSKIWASKTGWGSGLLGIGLIGLFTFGVGVMVGKSSGFAGALLTTLVAQ